MTGHNAVSIILLLMTLILTRLYQYMPHHLVVIQCQAAYYLFGQVWEGQSIHYGSGWVLGRVLGRVLFVIYCWSAFLFLLLGSSWQPWHLGYVIMWGLVEQETLNNLTDAEHYPTEIVSWKVAPALLRSSFNNALSSVKPPFPVMHWYFLPKSWHLSRLCKVLQWCSKVPAHFGSCLQEQWN